MDTNNKNNSTESIREYLNNLSKEEIDYLFSTSTDTSNTKPKKKKKKKNPWNLTMKHLEIT